MTPNKADLRLDKASKHNVRIDTGRKSKRDRGRRVRGGIYGTPADSDGCWATV